MFDKSSQRHRGKQHQFYYDIQLRGRTPERILCKPTLAFTPSMELTSKMVNLAENSAHFADQLAAFGVFDSFAWLPVVSAAGEKGQSRSSQIYDVWLARAGRFRPRAWAPHVTAERLFYVLTHLDTLMFQRDAPWREQFLDNLARQGRHLKKAEPKVSGDDSRLRVSIMRTLLSLCLPDDPSIGRADSAVLRKSLNNLAAGQIPKSWKEPARSILVLQMLTVLANTFAIRQLSPPQILEEALKVIRLFVGGLCVSPSELCVLPVSTQFDSSCVHQFNLPSRREASVLLEQAKIFRTASMASVCWIDGRDEMDFSGALTFASEGEVLLTNCGAPSLLSAAASAKDANWRRVLRTSAATTSLDYDGLEHARFRWMELSGERCLIIDRESPRGHRHSRRLLLTNDGQELLGEERLLGFEELPLFRFHVPPKARLEFSDDQSYVSLMTKSGQVWKFEAEGASISIEESVFAGIDGTNDQCNQIVLAPFDAKIAWGLSRIQCS